MESWIVYGLIASVFFGLSTFVYKVAQQKGNFSPYYGTFVLGIGIVLIFGIFFLFNSSAKFEMKSSGLVLGAGILWACGFLAVAIAISQKADISRLTPVFNTNTLVTVVLGIIFLHEVPDISQMFRVIAGAVLVIVGAVLVSI